MIRWLLNYISGASKAENADNLLANIDKGKIPAHIAIIMDGNGRWAQKRGLPRTAGHRAGVESLKAVVEGCGTLGVKYLTVYAFSTENWKRPQEEVNVLMNLISEYIDKELEILCNKGIKVGTIGEIEYLPVSAQKSIQKAKETTKENKKLMLNLALNYGSRTELVTAVKEIVKLSIQNQLQIHEVNEKTIAKYLDTRDMPDPDLLIRPSGELRISNFLLWQLAYTEFWYSNVLWPDFRQKHLYQAVIDFQKRDRRYGALKL
ncbi:MAG: isoprenyl transferase [Clostridia bacterium]|nr:isoprenyl transferase [Clostridia bacterium]